MTNKTGGPTTKTEIVYKKKPFDGTLVAAKRKSRILKMSLQNRHTFNTNKKRQARTDIKLNDVHALKCINIYKCIDHQQIITSDLICLHEPSSLKPISFEMGKQVFLHGTHTHCDLKAADAGEKRRTKYYYNHHACALAYLADLEWTCKCNVSQTTYNAVEYAECFCHCHVAHTCVLLFFFFVSLSHSLTLFFTHAYFRSIFNLHFYIGRYFSIILLLFSGHWSLLFESFKIIDRKLKCMSVAIVIVVNDFKRAEMHWICLWIALRLNDFYKCKYFFFV